MATLIKGKWHPLSEPAGYDGPAIYAIRLLNNGVVATIPRFLAPDNEGLLTIGMTSNLDRRRNQFMRGRKKGRGHSASNLLFLLDTKRKFASQFNTPEFEILFHAVEDKETAAHREAEMIRKYLFRFGEVPPLSSAVPNRYAHLSRG